MILVWLFLAPMLIAGLLSCRTDHAGRRGPGWVATGGLASVAATAVAVWWRGRDGLTPFQTDYWIAEFDSAWIPELAVRFHIGLDGLTAPLVALAALASLGAIAAIQRNASRDAHRQGILVLWLAAGLIGVLLAIDLVLLVLFWELALAAAHALAAHCAHRSRRARLARLVIVGQTAGLLFLLAGLGAHFALADSAAAFTFDHPTLLAATMPAAPGLCAAAAVGLLAVCTLGCFRLALPSRAEMRLHPVPRRIAATVALSAAFVLAIVAGQPILGGLPTAPPDEPGEAAADSSLPTPPGVAVDLDALLNEPEPGIEA